MFDQPRRGIAMQRMTGYSIVIDEVAKDPLRTVVTPARQQLSQHVKSAVGVQISGDTRDVERRRSISGGTLNQICNEHANPQSEAIIKRLDSASEMFWS